MGFSSKTAILTLASLAASNVTQKVNAAIADDTNENRTANSSVVIPVKEEVSLNVDNVENIAAPESTDIQQFSQNLPYLQSDTDNNLKVVSEIQSQKAQKSSDSKTNKTNKINSKVVIASSPRMDRDTPQFSRSAKKLSPKTPSKLSLNFSKKQNTKDPQSVSTLGKGLEKSLQDIAKTRRNPSPSIAISSSSSKNNSQVETTQSISIPVPSTSQSNNSQSNNSRSIPIKVSNTNQSNNSQINSQINTSQSNTIPRNTNQSIPTSVNSDLVVPAVDVQIIGTTPELQKTVRKVIKTQVGGDTSQRQIQTDIQAILNTGLFRNATVSSSETPTGLRVVYRVQPLIVRGIQLEGAKVLKYDNASLIFKSQINQPISPDGLKEAVKNINKWYADKGYSLARVVAIEPTRQGSLMIKVAEGVVGNIKFQFVNDDGKTVSDKGKPVKGRTKTEFLKKQIKLKSGDVFQDKIVRQDLQKLYSLGLFESANIALEGDANQADVIYKLKEVGARSVNLGGNYNADQGLVGTFNYSDNNVRGTNNNVGVNIQAGRRHLGFNAKYSSPYRSTNPDKLGYSINAFRRRGISETFDEDIKLPNGDKVRKGQFGASFQLQRPIEDWNATLGFNYSRTSLRDRKGVINSVDENGNPLSLSGTGIDDLTTVSLSATKDRRNNLMNPTNGSVLTLSSEQSIPLGQGNISMNRLQANYSQFVPVEVFKSKKKQVLAVNVQAGTVFGDLPPYETFNLGGSNSIRGYDAGDVASGRTYVLASAEYRFPIPVTNSLGGVLFADFGTDLGSGSTVIGNPAGVSGKPGAGFGYGAGLRLNSPLGLLRADYGISDHGETKLHFGIGHRF